MVAVRSILIRLRKRSGLSSARLDMTEIDITALLQLSVVRRYAHRLRTTPQAAAPVVIAHLADRLPPTLRLIVDAELCLGLLRESAPAGIDLEHLYAADLGERRRYLTLRWSQLHAAWQIADIPPAPTVRGLRGTPETQAFTALAELLTSVSDVETADMPTSATVTVVGDAAVDLMTIVETFPRPGDSIWGDFRRHPGGKGLNRAVALARLGLDARLVATVGADDEGQMILTYLHRMGVDTSLLRVTDQARTPVATVIMPLSGEFATIAFQEDRIRLTERDLDVPTMQRAFESSAAVLVTFEQPIDVVARVLAMVHDLPDPPWLLVNASPSVVLPGHVHEHLSAVDYLIGTESEIAATWPNSTARESIRRLLRLGVGAVCSVDPAGCTVHTAIGESIVPQVNTGMANSAGASTAFSAALAYRLVTGGTTASDRDFAWAAAAMSARRPVLNIPDSMPSVARIEKTIETGNLYGDIVIRGNSDNPRVRGRARRGRRPPEPDR